MSQAFENYLKEVITSPEQEFDNAIAADATPPEQDIDPNFTQNSLMLADAMNLLLGAQDAADGLPTIYDDQLLALIDAIGLEQ